VSRSRNLDIGTLEADALRARAQSSVEGRDLSRRQILALASAAVAGATPVARAVGAGLRGEFTVAERPGRIAFRLNGRDHWVIDTSRFAGKPKLRITRADELIRVSLTGARYPGTQLPADLVCVLRRGLSGWRMFLRLDLGRFRGRASFERWLSGLESLESSVSLRTYRSALDQGLASSTSRAARGSPSLTIGGQARARFGPDWCVRLAGRTIGRLSGVGEEVTSDAVLVALPLAGAKPLLQGAGPRRSVIMMEREDRPWKLEMPTGPAGTVVETGTDAFDQLTLEAWENRLGRTRWALRADSTDDRDSVRFRSELLIAEQTTSFHFPLRHARLARTFGESPELALLAAHSPSGALLHAGPCVVQLGDGGAAFRLHNRGARTVVSCRPGLLGVAAGLGGSIVEPVHPGPTQGGCPRTLEMQWDQQPMARAKDSARLRLWSGTPKYNLEIPNYTYAIIRPDDLLAIRMEYHGFELRLGDANPPRLVRTATDAVVIAHFPPQQIAEQAFFEVADGYPVSSSDPDGSSGPDNIPAPGNVLRILAGPSRLAFDVPASITEIPYTIEGVLDWRRFTQRVVSTALPAGGSTSDAVSEPQPDQTAIEAPFRLTLSPDSRAAWTHATTPVTTQSRTELWHTTLGLGAGTAAQPTVRAVWSPDYTTDLNQADWPAHYPPSSSANPFRMTLDARDRYEIVRLTSDYQNTVTAPVTVDRMMLTALGAWLNLRGAWDLQPPLEVEEWRHVTTMGRDHYVRVVYAGYLFPFGHRASLVKVTERKFDQYADNEIAAYLYQRMYVVVREPLKVFDQTAYPDGWIAGYQGRQMPFKSVLITTLVTPDLEPPAQVTGSIQAQDAFYPTVSIDGSPQLFQFHVRGTDWNGQTAEFATPLIFVGLDVSAPPSNQGAMSDVNNAYDGSINSMVPMAGQGVAFAPAAPPPPAGQPPPTDPSLETTGLHFGAAIPPDGTSLPPDQPQFYPVVLDAQVHIPAVKQLLGHDVASDIAIAPQFLQSGFDGGSNKGEVFAQLMTPVALQFGAGSGGQPVTPGVVSPNLSIAGLSRQLGPVGSPVPVDAGGHQTGLPDLSKVASGQFHPDEFFGDPTGLLGDQLPKLLGAIKLTDILGPIADFTGDPNAVPRLVRQQLPDALQLTYTWKTTNIDDSKVPIFVAGILVDPHTKIKTAGLEITATVTTPLNGGNPQYLIQGRLTNFSLQFGVMALPFNSLTFTVESGKKLHVEADVGQVIFEDFLQFVNQLRDFMSQFSDPPFLDVEADHITAGYTLDLPNIGVGVFSLQNVSLGAGLTVPYFGEAISVNFYFATKEHPFLLTVYIFGGGGYLQIGVGPHGLDSLDASIEFGAAVDLDLVIASGSVHIMAGIYFHYDSSGASLTGFLDAGGELDVLGLISISVEFHLSLSYQLTGADAGKVTGEASLTVEVDVAFFSKSVTLGPIKKSFGGSGGAATAALAGDLNGSLAAASRPLKIKEMIDKSDWRVYAEAFA
jgi:hypothetical protein